MIFECILKSFSQAEKKGESMPNIGTGIRNLVSSRNNKVVQSVIYSSEGGRRKSDWKEDWKERQIQ